MTIFTPYMNADLYQHTPDWQRIERYEYCSQMNSLEKKQSALSKFMGLFTKNNIGKAA